MDGVYNPMPLVVAVSTLVFTHSCSLPSFCDPQQVNLRIESLEASFSLVSGEQQTLEENALSDGDVMPYSIMIHETIKG